MSIEFGFLLPQTFDGFHGWCLVYASCEAIAECDARALRITFSGDSLGGLHFVDYNHVNFSSFDVSHQSLQSWTFGIAAGEAAIIVAVR